LEHVNHAGRAGGDEFSPRALILSEIVTHRASFVEEPMRSLRTYIGLTAAARPSNRPSDWLSSRACGSMQQTKKPEAGLTVRPE
jgi:hypothetical protein